MSINYSGQLGRDFSITAMGNFTYAASQFKQYDELDYPESYQSRIGYSISQTWGYIAEHLFVDDAEAVNSPVQFGTPGASYGAGDIKYRDVNRDGRITELDKVPIGYPTDPEIVYGGGFQMAYKNFDLGVFFQGSAHSSFFIDMNATSPFYDNVNDGVVSPNQLLKAYADDHWSENDRNLYALWPRLSSTPNENNNQISTWFMRNGTFLRLKQIDVGYTFPRSLSEKVKVDNIRIYARGVNLFTWSKYKLWDVEMAGNGLGYPLQKVFNMGIEVSF